MKKTAPIALCVLMMACGGDPPAVPDAGPVHTGATAPAGRSAAASLQAAFRGDVEGRLEATSALSGARYGRYHLSFAGRVEPGAVPAIISLARPGPDRPGPGTYALGEEGGFDGNVEIGGEHRDFAIAGGELVIIRADGDALQGRLAFSADERAADAGAPATIEVEGTFVTVPAG